MRFFCTTEKPSAEAIRKLAETSVSKNKTAGQIMGFEGAFCFSLPDVYVSDEVGKILDQSPDFSVVLLSLLKRTANNDYGDITNDDMFSNVENRYLGFTSWGIVAKYQTKHGCIRLEVFRHATLLFLDGENTDAFKEKYDS